MIRVRMCKYNYILKYLINAHQFRLGCCCILLIFFSTLTAANEDKIIINTAFWEPVSTENNDGYFDQIMYEAFHRLGMVVEIRRPPAERGLINANDGTDDGDGPRIANIRNMDLYSNLVIVPEKVMDVQFVAFSLTNSISINNWNDLENYNIGIVTGWKILELSIDKYKSLIKVKNPYLLFNLLKSRRVDVVIIDKWTGKKMMDKFQLTGVTIHDSPPLAEREMFLFLNKNHQQLVDRLTKVLNQMKLDGSFSRIEYSTLNTIKQH